MKRTFILISMILIGMVAIVVFLRFVIGGSEDDWICINGEWVKHGVPSAPKPTTGCGQP